MDVSLSPYLDVFLDVRKAIQTSIRISASGCLDVLDFICLPIWMFVCLFGFEVFELTYLGQAAQIHAC